VFAFDTSAEASALLVSKWRSMSFVEKGELVEAMCLEADELARLGIAFREGVVTIERERHLMAIRRYGQAFADAYFAENSPVPLPPMTRSNTPDSTTSDSTTPDSTSPSSKAPSASAVTGT
jgi:hypothetical protein